MKSIRCAIYTRKSSEEGLEQAFNSLDAQREACAAYVLSQASEGWVALPDVYDDGGLSGGSLERPALQRLLGEVTAGRIDIIVVYKVDRLTRSLLDFARLVEAFDKAGTSFVSVTQAFNTTTSMGRLTLNMLLSFAQFEREVTAERIRDKIAASKARGMWMGGTPPLGYQPDGRSLAIVEDHAALVRDIYRRYLHIGNVRLVVDDLARDGIAAPARATAGGRAFGGVAFTRGQLYALLKNPIYVGDIAHRGKVHAGRHPPIIDREGWDQVQAMLADHLQGSRRATRAKAPSLLAGLIVDDAGEPLIATHACKGRVRYRYYVSRLLQHNGSATDTAGMRLPAREIEAAVTARIAEAFDDPFALAGSAALAITPTSIPHLARCASDTARLLRERHRMTVRALVGEVRVHPGRIEIDCRVEAVAEVLQLEATPDAPTIVTLTAEVTLTRTGRAMRLVQDSGAAMQRTVDAPLARLVAKARRWWEILREGELDVSALAAAEGVRASYVTRVVRLAFLSPAVTDAILRGGARAEIDASALTQPGAVPACWHAQAREILPVGVGD